MKLDGFFEENKRIAVAFSGGVDSAYLLYAAVRAGADVKAYCVRSAFQPGFEFEDARKLAELIGTEFEVIEVDVLSDEKVTANPADRTNASDDATDRPGTKALQELGIRSPLRECGLSKTEIRRLSKEAGLPTWNKPAYACLATRIRTGEKITAEKLRTTEKAEAIMQDMGFSDFRVRMRGKDALVQIEEGQHADALMRESEIKAALAGLYKEVEIDKTPRLRNIDLKELGL